MKVSYTEFFKRLSQRERTLIGILAGILFLMVGGLSYLLFRATMGSFEDEVQDYRHKLKTILAKTPEYLEYKNRKKQIETAIKENEITSLRITLNDLSKKVFLTDFEGEAEEVITQSRLSDIISFEGKTQETQIEKSGKKAKKSKKPIKSAGDEKAVFEIEQKMEFREVPLRAFFDFLEHLENAKELIFVSKLEISRRFNNFENARTSLAVVTYKEKTIEGIK